ncbi:SigE family RNA polymerase sigma factor [Micromonospora soli]|uniref:SigE family RNA polymerase sigma factor n=1 Tax=Micromonospora sp. NBRC 110009 TaxID=3061627 RepID=UPI002672FE07|nr:SigE family RNA polymerase sigma factor [Micromonospora sp. NBRC 110009]WKU01788.1 SigE family RNA polymerase sigma factor [Micromonospora sp. NBRC 110009]
MSKQQEFDEFVVACSRRLLRMAYLLTRDWVAAEDLLQTALTKAWFAWHRIESNPEPYVRKIIVNTYASWWRRRWNAEEPVADPPERTGPSSDPFAALDVRDELWRSLGRLPKRQRTVLVLRYFEDMTEAEIAQAMGCTAGTVKSQASKALAKLRLDETLGVMA